MCSSVSTKTPTVTALDNRGLAVRDIAYHRHPDTPCVTNQRITCHQYDGRGFLIRSADPRLREVGRSNFTYQTDLFGTVLRTHGVDAGIHVVLNDAAGRSFMAVTNIGTGEGATDDHRRTVTQVWHYESNALPGRLLSTTEQVTGESLRVKERFVWADNSAAHQAKNLAGQCISHYDTAGLVQTNSIALSGVPLSVSRRLLKDADNPDIASDWQGNGPSAWDDLLADETFLALTTADATGNLLTATDAAGNLQRMKYDVAGQLAGSWLTIKGEQERIIVKSLTWSAVGQKLREEHGNGVVTTWAYEPQTQRLLGNKTERPAGHASGMKVLLDLRYEYDPVGNVLSVHNDAEETRFWRNQKVMPESNFTYDSLYQLIHATGREMAGIPQGNSLPAVTYALPSDGTSYTNYTRTFLYDAAGNLTQMRHSAPATSNNYTTNITVSEHSNRAVLNTLADQPAEVDALFTTSGQQKRLQPGQNLGWTPRGELLKVIPVARDGGADDSESYRYDGSHQRLLKVTARKTSKTMRTLQVIYLPGLEQRTTTNGDTTTEQLQVITVGERGWAQVRVLHWEAGQPPGIRNDQVRWSYDNLIGSSGLEVDGDGCVISLEEYYPYGGTAVWTARSQAEAAYKTLRYSGKERDVTGLYYYGYRYYQPWAARWLSADPGGTVDGLNLFRMVRNNPVTWKDNGGKLPFNTVPPPPPPAPAPPAPMPPAPRMPPPPPVPGSQGPAKVKWVIKKDPALYKQQGGEYPYYSSFAITLGKLKIEHYGSITDMDSFIGAWREVGHSMVPPAKNIDYDKALEVQTVLKEIDAEWSGYHRADVTQTYRGDTPAIINSYPWLAEFAKDVGKSATSRSMDLEVKSPMIMSTAKDPKMGYVSGKSIMWHFELEPGHAGVSEGLYASEGEVTFPIYNKMKIVSLQYLPEGTSYMDNPERFGTAHRYVIKAKMFPRSKNQ